MTPAVHRAAAGTSKGKHNLIPRPPGCRLATYWLCLVQVLPDDVAAQFPGPLLLHRAAERLHAVLHLPNAHPVHGAAMFACVLQYHCIVRYDVQMLT
jgi:hypothetical protein